MRDRQEITLHEYIGVVAFRYESVEFSVVWSYEIQPWCSVHSSQQFVLAGIYTMEDLVHQVERRDSPVQDWTDLLKKRRFM